MPNKVRLHPNEPVKIVARAEFEILPDGQHANFRLIFDGTPPEEFQKWARFAYCNDLVWRICAMMMDGNDTSWGMVRRDLYTPIFRHIYKDQFLVPGAD